MGLARQKESIVWDHRRVPSPGNLRALRQCVGAQRAGVILESVSGLPGARYSIFAFDPVRTIVVASDSGQNPFEEMAAAWRPWLPPSPEPDLPFVGGWIGFLAYETGRFVEPSAGWTDRPCPVPMAYWSLFDTVLIHDGLLDDWVVAGLELPESMTDGPRPPLRDRLDRLAKFAAQVREDEDARSPMCDAPIAGHWNDSKAAYLAKVGRSLAYIRAGDVFQVNIARKFRMDCAEHPVSVYQRLCEINPAPYAAYISLPATEPAQSHRSRRAVISCSPELFLRKVGRDLSTRPIKGTRPRVDVPERDAVAVAELAESEKDRAELNMIIDLERNDLGRVCEYGSVRVLDDGEIESHPTVYHRAATIRGRLTGGRDAIDLLKAMFPGGSITGTPKVRAMQIINELETDARGTYCGAIGFVGLDGNLHLNLAIRTMTAWDGVIDLQVGSGIVADSDPEAEYLELEAKAAGMMAALGAAPDPRGVSVARAAI